MKRYLLATAIAAASLSLAGCATIATGLGVAPKTIATVRLDTAKALDIAYDALDGVTVSLVEPAIKAGQLHGQAAAQVATALRQARSILDTLYTAYNAGTAADPGKAVNAVADLIKSVKTVLAGVGAPSASAGPASWSPTEPWFGSTPHLARLKAGADVDRVLAQLQRA